MTKELLEAKRALYVILLELLKRNEERLTDGEVDILYLLFKDKELRSYSKKKIKNNIRV